MKKEEFVKLGVSEDIAVKCEESSQEELKGFIPKSSFNEVNEENKTLKQTITDRDKQLNDLKESSGDSVELKKQIEDLQKQNAAEKAAHDKEIAQLKLDNAVETALTAAGVKNNKALRALLDAEKIKLDESGKLTGLSEQLEAVRKTDGYLFNEKNGTAPIMKGFQPGASGDVKPDGKTDFSKMTYSEMTAYLAQNPGAKIE